MKVDSIPGEGMGGTPCHCTRKGYLFCQKWRIGGLGVHIRLRGGVSLYKPLSSIPPDSITHKWSWKKQRKEDKFTLQGANESLAIFSTIAPSNLWKLLSEENSIFLQTNLSNLGPCYDNSDTPDPNGFSYYTKFWCHCPLKFNLKIPANSFSWKMALRRKA